MVFPKKPMIKHLRRINNHTFRGRRYAIKWRKPKTHPLDVGTCDPPHVVNKTIEIDPRQEEKEILRVAIDEGLHACHWDIDNDSVDETSTCLSDFLWRIGFRLAPQENNFILRDNK